MSEQITPTVGRVVWYYPSVDSGKGQPYPAIITHVWGDACVNLSVQNDASYPLPAGETNPTSVALATDGESPAGRTWAWMPYQTGQAAKSKAQLDEVLKEISKVWVALDNVACGRPVHC